MHNADRLPPSAYFLSVRMPIRAHRQKTLVNETGHFHDILLPLFCPPKATNQHPKGYPAHVCMSLSPRPYAVMRSFPESPAEKKSVFSAE